MSKRAFVSRAAESRAAYEPGVRTFQVAEDIVPIAEFKAKISDMVRALDTRPRPLVVTLNGKPAAVVMSPREYDRLSYHARLIDAVNDGLEDVEEGRTISADELMKRVRTRYGRKKR